MKEIKVGLLGLGTVGAGVAKVIATGRNWRRRRALQLYSEAIADKDTTFREKG